MNQTMKSVWIFLNYFRTVPAYLLVTGCKFSEKCKMDMDAYSQYGYKCKCNLFIFSGLLLEEKSIRNVMLNRLHRNLIRYCLFRILFRPLDSLFINMSPEAIGGGLSFQHGFSTIIAAKSIGEYCRIYQQCTIGFNGDKAPIIDDNCRICAGANVIGGIHLHSGCVIGAGAVVVKDIFENAIAVGVPAKEIKRNEEAIKTS